MKENKDALKAIQEFADESPTRSDKLEQAKQLTRELYGEDGAEAEHRGRGGAVALAASSKRTRILTIALCCVALLLVVAILLPFLLREKESPIHYYDDVSIYSETISDIDQFISENNLEFAYYDHDYLASQHEAYRLIENDRLVYILQNVIFLRQNDFDSILLGICFSNDEFQKFDEFKGFTESLLVGGIEVDYKILEQDWNYIYAKFSVDDVVYYLNVTTSGGAEVLEQYVNLLLA